MTGILSMFEYRYEEWMESSACRTYHPDDWFWDTNTTLATKHAVRAICKACPVVTQCLEYALRTGTTEGIYGGLTPSQRNDLRRATNAPKRVGARVAYKKTPTCRNGHEYTAANTHIDTRGWRVCLTCRDTKLANARARRAAAKRANNAA